MEIKTASYSIEYDNIQEKVALKGSFRLVNSDSDGPESYQGMIGLLNSAAANHPSRLTIDMRELEFLNSSGINAICKFVISVRQGGKTALTVLGSKDYSWQGKSLINLKRLMPGLELVI